MPENDKKYPENNVTKRMLIDKSLEIRRKINDKNGIIYSLRYLGVMYEKQNKINKHNN